MTHVKIELYFNNSLEEHKEHDASSNSIFDHLIYLPPIYFSTIALECFIVADYEFGIYLSEPKKDELSNHQSDSEHNNYLELICDQSDHLD